MTAKYRKRKNLCFWLSALCWLGLCGFLVIYGLSATLNGVAVTPAETTEETVSLLDVFMPLIVTYGIACVIVLFIREKARNTVWIANIILSAVIFGNVFMYVSIGLFALDEFILCPLYRHYKLKYTINKEIDAR